MGTSQTTFNTRQAAAVAGMLANTELENRISRTVESVAPGIAFGQPAFRGSDDHGCIVGGTQAMTAGSAAGSGNTGNGTMGAVTVTAGAKIGVYNLLIVEPGSNVGSFVLYDPDGDLVDNGVVASAFSAGGLAFTLADGSTDFVAGDSFAITVTASINLALLGIVLKDPAQPANATYPDYVAQYQTASILTRGIVWVTAGATVADGDQVYWNPATGRFTNTATHVILKDCVFDSSGVDGDLVRISVANRLAQN